MPVKRLKKKRQSKGNETVDLINQALVKKDLHELRRLASVRGLVHPHLRKQVWPLLLGVSATSNGSAADAEVRAQPGNDTGRARRDAQTIDNDVARCLHEGQVDVGTQDRTALRAALTRLLHSVTDGNNVYYYQGLHEIAMTLLLQVGEAQARPLLRRLVCTQLRDNTRRTLDAVTESLAVVQAIISSSDAPLGEHLRRAQVPPYFAISWVLTWFAHNVDSAMVPRLFDLFLASHPLMPLYLYVAGVLEVRDELLALDTMEDLHTFLVNFNPFAAGTGINALAMKSVKLINRLPPERMARRCAGRFVHSCAVEAQLVNDTWWVPETPPQRSKLPEMVQSLGDNAVLRRTVLAPLAAAGAVAGIAVLLTLGPPTTRFPAGPL